MLQGAGGWEWSLLTARWFSSTTDALPWAIYAIIVGYWLWRWRRSAPRWIGGLFAVASALFCVVLTDLPLWSFVGAFFPVLLVVGFNDWRHHVDDYLDGDDRALVDGLLFAALATASLWVATSGFLVPNVDFTFGLEWFGDYFDRERDVFIATYSLTLLKYGLPALGVVFAAWTTTNRRRFHAAMAGVTAFFALKILTLTTQIFVGALPAIEQRHELAFSDLLFVYALVVVIGLGYAAIRLGETLANRSS